MAIELAYLLCNSEAAQAPNPFECAFYRFGDDLPCGVVATRERLTERGIDSAPFRWQVRTGLSIRHRAEISCPLIRRKIAAQPLAGFVAQILDLPQPQDGGMVATPCEQIAAIASKLNVLETIIAEELAQQLAAREVPYVNAASAQRRENIPLRAYAQLCDTLLVPQRRLHLSSGKIEDAHLVVDRGEERLAAWME